MIHKKALKITTKCEHCKGEGVVLELRCPNCGGELSFDRESASMGLLQCKNCSQCTEK